MGDCPVLNFDPYRWNVEHDRAAPQSVAGVATVATVRAENETSNLRQAAATVATPATLPARHPPASILRDWHRHLAPLDFDCAPDGFARNRWRELCDDSWWIYENFAAQAVHDGWSAQDLFGVLPFRPGWGGLCDRLQGARNLKMGGERAAWSRFGVKDWACRGAGDDLIASGLVLIWERGSTA